MGVQPHSAYLARTRPEDQPSKITSPHTKYFTRPKSEGVHSAEADDLCVSFYVCAEENREVCAPAQLRGAHQPGRPDFVRVGAQQPRLIPR